MILTRIVLRFFTCCFSCHDIFATFYFLIEKTFTLTSWKEWILNKQHHSAPEEKVSVAKRSVIVIGLVI